MRKHGVTGFFRAPLPTSSRRTSIQIPAKTAAAMQACHSLAPHPRLGQLSGPG